MGWLLLTHYLYEVDTNNVRHCVKLVMCLLFLTENENVKEEAKCNSLAVRGFFSVVDRKVKCVLSTLPAVRSKSQVSGGVALGLSEATAETSVLAGLRPPAPTPRHHIPSPPPAHTDGQGPAPTQWQHPWLQRLLLHLSALWLIDRRIYSLINTKSCCFLWNNTHNLF